jgi:hypothetical protein
MHQDLLLRWLRRQFFTDHQDRGDVMQLDVCHASTRQVFYPIKICGPVDEARLQAIADEIQVAVQHDCDTVGDEQQYYIDAFNPNPHPDEEVLSRHSFSVQSATAPATPPPPPLPAYYRIGPHWLLLADPVALINLHHVIKITPSIITLTDHPERKFVTLHLDDESQYTLPATVNDLAATLRDRNEP